MKIFYAALLCLTGCATQQPSPPKIAIEPHQAAIAFYSEPPGAMILSGDLSFGPAPATIKWTLPKDLKETVSDRPITARWPSGATVTMTPKIVGGKPQYYVFKRPADAPNAETDIAHGQRLTNTNYSESGITSDQALQLLNIFAGAAANYQQGRNTTQTNPILLQDVGRTNSPKLQPVPTYVCETNVLGNGATCRPR